MTIAWTYLDKRRAAEDAIKDRGSMEYIIATHREDEAALREDLASPSSSTPSGLPGAHDPHAGEARLAGGIDEIDVLQERYRRALEYMAWFKPAWDALSDDDRYMLTEFYDQAEGSQTDAIGGICDRYHIERTSAYNKKNRALAKLTLLLYGK